jgi:hypothetical protein
LFEFGSDGHSRHEYPTPASITSLTRLSNGSILLAGPEYIEQLDANLKRIWITQQPGHDGHEISVLEAPFTQYLANPAEEAAYQNSGHGQAPRPIYIARNIPTPEGDQARVYRLDTNGKPLWKTELQFPAQSNLLSKPLLALSPAGNLIVVQSNTRDRHLSALDPMNGGVFLEKALPGRAPVKTLHTLNDQLFIYGGKTLLQVNMEGALIREFELPGQSPLTTGGATLSGNAIIEANSFSDEQLQLRTYAARFQIN